MVILKLSITRILKLRLSKYTFHHYQKESLCGSYFCIKVFMYVIMKNLFIVIRTIYSVYYSKP